MKIGITCYPSVGGSGIIATELGILMAERGHEVHFITSNMPFRLKKPVPNITFHQVDINLFFFKQKTAYEISLSTKIANVINEYDLDVLHMHYAIPHAICGILARQMSGKNIKIMTTLHGTDITVLGYDHALQNAIKFGIEKSDIVTSVSQSLKEETYEIIQPEKEIIPIYNFVKEKDFPQGRQPKLRTSYGIAEDEKVVIHVSNFRKVKRIDTVIDTFHLIRQKMKAKLLLIGDGPELLDMRQRVKSLQLSEDVLFLGKQDCMSNFYQISDLLLLMSEKESFGLTLLEAMHTGVLPIGTRAGGIQEVIKHEETGFLVDIGDAETAAQYAVSILQNPTKYQQMQTKMLLDIQERFNSKKIADQYEYYYQQMLGDSKVHV